MSHSLNKSESLIKPFPQLPKFLDLGLPFGKLFGLELNKNVLHEKKETYDKIYTSAKDGEL